LLTGGEATLHPAFWDVNETLVERGFRTVLLSNRTLSCACDFIETCHGGCRFRASTYNGSQDPDPVQCCRYGALVHRATEEVQI